MNDSKVVRVETEKKDEKVKEDESIKSLEKESDSSAEAEVGTKWPSIWAGSSL